MHGRSHPTLHGAARDAGVLTMPTLVDGDAAPTRDGLLQLQQGSGKPLIHCSQSRETDHLQAAADVTL